MPDTDTRLDRIETILERLVGVTGEMARELRSLVQGLAADRDAFRQTLRDLSGFVATAGLEMSQLTRQMGRLVEITETGFAQMQTLLGENNRLIVENNAVIRRLLEILARGRRDGEGPPQ